MMAKTSEDSSFDEILQSHLFTFYVGEERKPYVVHSGAVAASSSYFRTLVKGDMTGSQTLCAELTDVDPEDFGRYLEFVYRYDYTVPSWTQDVQTVEPSRAPVSNPFFWPPGGMSNVEAVAVPEAPYEYPPRGDPVSYVEPEPQPYEPPPPEPAPRRPGFFGPVPYVGSEPEPEPYEPPPPEPAPRRLGFLGAVPYDLPIPELRQALGTRAQRKKQQQMVGMDVQDARSRFENRDYLSNGHPKMVLLKYTDPPPNTNAGQNYTPIFLAHARLYTFAGMRHVDSLKELALHKLQCTLLEFQLYKQRVGDVLALARYAYANGRDRAADGKLDELRELVVEYMAGDVGVLGTHADFVKMLEGGGEFVGDFWAMVI